MTCVTKRLRMLPLSEILWSVRRSIVSEANGLNVMRSNVLRDNVRVVVWLPHF